MVVVVEVVVGGGSVVVEVVGIGVVVEVVVAEHLLSCWVMVSGMTLRAESLKLLLLASMTFTDFPSTRPKASV